MSRDGCTGGTPLLDHFMVYGRPNRSQTFYPLGTKGNLVNKKVHAAIWSDPTVAWTFARTK